MYCIKKITNDLFWIGGNDRRLSLFEGVYSVPYGVSYNSYILTDDKIVIFDTVDKAVSDIYFENIGHVLGNKKPDYIIVQHMEPDHSATLKQLLLLYPDITIVCNAKTVTMINQFFEIGKDVKFHIVKEGDTLETGNHTLNFVMAPMVHWPEVMVTYDSVSEILFSADAFGTFGALNGAIFADEVDFARDYMDEARRYYTNIVGKYGAQVQALLKKASALNIKYICPLHGFVWRNGINDFVEKYQLWSSYTPEEQGVMIAYASVYGHTESAAEIVSSKLREKGIKTVMFDVSVTPTSEIVSAAFKWSHLLFASTTYNAGIFISMEDLLRDLVSHNIQKRTVAFIENGSWAPTSGNLMKELISKCKDMNILENTITLKSSLKESQMNDIDNLVNAIADTFEKPALNNDEIKVNSNSLFNISYGLYLLTTKDGDKDNGCIINTVQLLTDSPKRISMAVNKVNYSNELVQKTKKFNISILTQKTDFDTFKRFGFQSGKDVNKFADTEGFERSDNNIFYMKDANTYISAEVENMIDCGTHTLFIAKVIEAKQLSNEPSVTYDYYFKHIKTKPAKTDDKKIGWTCKICGYFYEGKDIPADYICPLCKHGVSDFEFNG